MVSARRFEDLQVDHEGKDLGELTPIESAPRALSRPELTVGEAPPAALPGV
jgi:DNA recombination protein RmuC